MTNAEKEAREIVDDVVGAYESSLRFGPDFDATPFIRAILRFAREYGPEIAKAAELHRHPKSRE